MSLKEFDAKFGLTASIEEEKRRFVNRIELGIFTYLKRSIDDHDGYDAYSTFFKSLCFALGENPRHYLHQSGKFHNLRSFTQSDFIKTLRIVVAAYQSGSNNVKHIINRVIPIAIDKSNINLGIKWNDGIFYPTGDEILDKELIDTSLQLLDKYPNEKKDLKTALENYHAKKLYGVVENCYLAVEGLGRNLLSNNNTLIDNKPKLLALLEFSPYWNKILANYLNYANEYRRHAGEDRHNIKPNEVEAFLYLTCLMIRAILKR